MREVISLHIGQFGVQTGNALWELYCLEHGVLPNGQLQEPIHDPTGFSGFFEERINGYFSPRAIFSDLESSVIDQIRAGKYRGLHRSERLIKGKEDAANNYARGRYTIGRLQLEQTAEAIRNQVEICDQMTGFISFHSLGGGTGSGFNSLLNELINDEFGKKGLIEVALFPSHQMSTSIVEPYNTVLATHIGMNESNCVMLVDNEAIHNICSKNLCIDKVGYSFVNRLIAQAISTTTCSLRFDSHLQTDFMDFRTNLVPYPRLHFPIVSIAPINSPDKINTDTTDTIEMTAKCFEQQYRMATCDNENGLYMACCLIFRRDFTPKNIHAALDRLKKKIKFVDWCPTGFKLGLNYQSPVTVPESEIVKASRLICMLCNNTAMQKVWHNLHSNYQMMSSKGAFYHWYLGEGMEEAEFREASHDIKNLISDYYDVSSN